MRTHAEGRQVREPAPPEEGTAVMYGGRCTRRGGVRPVVATSARGGACVAWAWAVGAQVACSRRQSTGQHSAVEVVRPDVHGYIVGVGEVLARCRRLGARELRNGRRVWGHRLPGLGGEAGVSVAGGGGVAVAPQEPGPTHLAQPLVDAVLGERRRGSATTCGGSRANPTKEGHHLTAPSSLCSKPSRHMCPPGHVPCASSPLVHVLLVIMADFSTSFWSCVSTSMVLCILTPV